MGTLGEVKAGWELGKQAYQLYKKYFDKVETIFSIGNKVQFTIEFPSKNEFSVSVAFCLYLRLIGGEDPIFLRTSMLEIHQDVVGIFTGGVVLTPYFQYESIDDLVHYQFLKDITQDISRPAEIRQHAELKQSMLDASKRISKEHLVNPGEVLQLTSMYRSEPEQLSKCLKSGVFNIAVSAWISYFAREEQKELESKDVVAVFRVNVQNLPEKPEAGTIAGLLTNIENIHSVLY
jgi:hypothetical protein